MLQAVAGGSLMWAEGKLKHLTAAVTDPRPVTVQEYSSLSYEGHPLGVAAVADGGSALLTCHRWPGHAMTAATVSHPTCCLPPAVLCCLRLHAVRAPNKSSGPALSLLHCCQHDEPAAPGAFCLPPRQLHCTPVCIRQQHPSTLC